VLEQSIIFIQIIFIDIIMAADNAIIIGLIAANFAPKNRKQIIMYGVFAAFLFRIIFALSATYLFEFAIIKIVGGALLVWIVNDLRQDLFGKKKKIKSPTRVSKEPSFFQGMYKVIFADITLSFDNVIGVVGASKDNFGLMIFGLLLSVVLIGAIATYFAEYIQKNKWIGYVGLIVILIVAIQLIIGGLNDYGVLYINETFIKYF
jgi:YjbE family integral membrane protein